MVSSYVTLFLFLEYIGNGQEYTSFLYIAELIVYRCPENLHRRGKTHIGIHQGGGC